MKTTKGDSTRYLSRLYWLVLLVALVSSACFSPLTQSHRGEAKDKSVYITIKGDQQLSHRFSDFMTFSLEDAGFARTKSRSEAAVVISGDVTARTETRDIGVGIVRVQVTQHGKTTKKDTCASLNSNAESEVFDGAAKNVVSNLRETYPNAHTIRFDPASDTKASQVFADQLPIALKNEEFSNVASGDADLHLHVELTRQRVAVAERLAQYRIESSWKGEESSSSSTGTSIVSASVSGPVPEACPAQFEDLSWLEGNSLYADANMIAKSLTRERLRRQKAQPQPEATEKGAQ